MAKYLLSKSYKELGSVVFRQAKANNHCQRLHGYALSFHFEFEASTLDAAHWVMNFGGFRELKTFLEDKFDHTLLVAKDDPAIETLMALGEQGLAKVIVMEKTGCEALADYLYDYVNGVFLQASGEQERVWCTKVEVREKESNMAMRVGERDS